jgi:hypothetical protein
MVARPDPGRVAKPDRPQVRRPADQLDHGQVVAGRGRDEPDGGLAGRVVADPGPHPLLPRGHVGVGQDEAAVAVDDHAGAAAAQARQVHHRRLDLGDQVGLAQLPLLVMVAGPAGALGGGLAAGRACRPATVPAGGVAAGPGAGPGSGVTAGAGGGPVGDLGGVQGDGDAEGCRRHDSDDQRREQVLGPHGRLLSADGPPSTVVRCCGGVSRPCLGRADGYPTDALYGRRQVGSRPPPLRPAGR